MSSEPDRKLRWFQFRLRTLLIFTAVCAVGFGFVARHIEQKRNEREVLLAKELMGNGIQF